MEIFEHVRREGKGWAESVHIPSAHWPGPGNIHIGHALVPAFELRGDETGRLAMWSSRSSSKLFETSAKLDLVIHPFFFIYRIQTPTCPNHILEAHCQQAGIGRQRLPGRQTFGGHTEFHGCSFDPLRPLLLVVHIHTPMHGRPHCRAESSSVFLFLFQGVYQNISGADTDDLVSQV